MQLPEIGQKGQMRLAHASVLVIGAGGLGTVVATYLVSMGIGNIGIADNDTIDETNLHRQFHYTAQDIGKKKAEILTSKLQFQNPGIIIIGIDNHINNANASDIIKPYDLICDCTDTMESRIIIDEHCFINNKPLIYGAVKEWEGYVTIFNSNQKIRLSDLFSREDMLYSASNSCSIAGVSSTVCGLIGSYMTNEIIKLILDIDSILDGKIMCIEMLNNNFKILKINKFKRSNM